MMKISSFSLFGLDVSLYGLCFALGIFFGVFVAGKLATRRGLKEDDIYLLALYIIPISIIGARLYYVLFSNGSYSFLDFFKIWEGGLAVYGGIIGGVLAIVLFCCIHKKNIIKVCDVCVTGLLLGQGIGRIGCYFGGCCFGVEILKPALQFFPFGTLIHGVWHYSTFFYESFLCFLCFVLFITIINKKVEKTGVMTCLYLVCYGVIRFVVEGFRGDSLYLGSFRVSRLLSAVLVIVGIIFIVLIYTNKNKARKNGESS